MRIVGGRWRGRRLAAVGQGDAAAHLRPTTDRVRESVFNLLRNSQGLDFEGLAVLDAFAGTGAFGFEALSRGAARATFLDTGRKAQGLLKENARLLGAEAVSIQARDATRPGAGAAHGLVFLDPPYGRGLGEAALAALQAGGWIAPGATVVWEEGAEVAAPPGWAVLDARRYGDTRVTLLRAA